MGDVKWMMVIGQWLIVYGFIARLARDYKLPTPNFVMVQLPVTTRDVQALQFRCPFVKVRHLRVPLRLFPG